MTHYTKGTPSPDRSAPTDCRRPVSGTVSLPSSGCFSPFPHGTCSLSVSKEYLAFEGGPPIFRQDFTCPALLNASAQTSRTGLSPSLARFSNPVPVALTARLVRVRSPLLAESRLISFPPGTEMFQFPGFASKTLCVQVSDTWFTAMLTAQAGQQHSVKVGCPIRRSADQSLFPASRGLSQGITSFIASCCQGIHQTPFSRLI